MINTFWENQAKKKGEFIELTQKSFTLIKSTCSLKLGKENLTVTTCQLFSSSPPSLRLYDLKD